MKRDLKSVISDLKSGKGPRLLLLFGDDLQVQDGCKAVLDQLIPQEQRGFNLERYDGRSASWEQIEASLATPPLFPGRKLLWVENVPYFFTREQKGEVGEKILVLWREGKKDEAVKLFLDLLVVEGWTQEQWDNRDSGTTKQLSKLLESAGADSQDDAEALVTYCLSREIVLTKRKGSEEQKLAVLLDQGVPEWSVLLLTAVQVDRRTRLYKRFEDSGAALYLAVERDRSGKVSRESLLEFIGQQLRQANKSVEPQARELIINRAGDDLRALQQELEKLFNFVGDRGSIRVEDVEAIVTDQGEGWIFDLTRAIGDRDSGAALSQLARLLAQGEPALKVLGTLAAEIRRLLAARQLLATDLARAWKRGMSYQQFQQNVLKDGSPLLTRNPYGDYMCFQRAERFSLAELVSYMEDLFETDVRLKSSGGQPRLLMERLILRMCLGLRQRRRSGKDRVAV